MGSATGCYGGERMRNVLLCCAMLVLPLALQTKGCVPCAPQPPQCSGPIEQSSGVEVAAIELKPAPPAEL